MTKQTCAHCRWSGTAKTVEWNPLDEHWQCKDVVKCAQRAAEAKLARGLGQALRNEKRGR